MERLRAAYLCMLALRVVLAALLLSAPSAPVAASPVTALPDCLGKPQVRPSQVIFACGDGNFTAQKLTWTGWGEPFAAATGTGEVNDCTPNCAAGKFHTGKIVLIASGSQRCPDGRQAYATVTYAWIGKPPIATPMGDPAQRFDCGPRR